MLESRSCRLDPDLPLPAYAKPGDAGLDLRAREDVVLQPAGGRALVPTRHRASPSPRATPASCSPAAVWRCDHGVTCLNTPGLIDSGYRGEIMVLLVNTDPSEDFDVERGERIAQLVIQRVEHVEFVVGRRARRSERGDGGFGHTGR